MADKQITIGIPNDSSIQQTYKDLEDGTYAPVVTSPSLVSSLTLVSGTALSDAFDMGEVMGGQVHLPGPSGSWTAANIGFKVCDTINGTYLIALDQDGVPLQITNVSTARGGSYAIPISVFPSRFVKLWSKNTTTTTETDVNQAATRSVKVVLK